MQFFCVFRTHGGAELLIGDLQGKKFVPLFSTLAAFGLKASDITALEGIIKFLAWIVKRFAGL